jgi:hypothetical protein
VLTLLALLVKQVLTLRAVLLTNKKILTTCGALLPAVSSPESPFSFFFSAAPVGRVLVAEALRVAGGPEGGDEEGGGLGDMKSNTLYSLQVTYAPRMRHVC